MRSSRIVPPEADYVITAYKRGVVMLETWHRGEASRDIELVVYRGRLDAGDFDRVIVTNRVPPFGSYEVQ